MAIEDLLAPILEAMADHRRQAADELLAMAQGYTETAGIPSGGTLFDDRMRVIEAALYRRDADAFDQLRAGLLAEL